MEIEQVHISEIRPGDTVIHKTHERTVGKKDIKRCPLLGHVLFGDPYNLGTIKVKRVIYPRFYKGKRV
ncbi:hypothetical protein PAHA111176_08165 [Parendozoicomonas haliclonae]|uniref:Uncharacterized protein n=1 Tax=Parendozoicomonas haliclonae TaxID=1960125 RepID=A0A1X7AE80_9GAMM|nr:hypothetical protein EHSB41UT_00298 [Parendozoicomonas haliclonae]